MDFSPFLCSNETYGNYCLILNSLPAPNQEGISIRKTEGGIAAALKFSGKPTDDIVREKEKQLRSSLIKDGLKPQSGCMLARYNDPGRTWKFIMVYFYVLNIVRFIAFLFKFLFCFSMKCLFRMRTLA